MDRKQASLSLIWSFWDAKSCQSLNWMYGSGFRGTVVILAHITAQVSVSQLLVTSWKNKASQLHLFALAPVAHLDRASVYGTEGRGFESLQAHHPRSKCRDAAKVKNLNYTATAEASAPW